MRIVVAVVAALLASACAVDPWMNVHDSPADRAKALLAKMNQTEKINMVHGWTGQYVGNVPANTRLNIPSLNLNDGPQGFRDNSGLGTTTQWPSGLSVAATWDVSALQAWGEGMGEEFVGKGANVQLGPGVCLARVPRNGRNFEYLSGEDPFLGYTLVQPAVKGIQSKGVIANAKHYIMNNQETNRGSVSENVDERTIMELYEGPFRGAVEAGVGSIMCSYNRINGVYSCENAPTLSVNLKQHLNYSYWVMSDWGATHSTVNSANNGLDQEMPSDVYFGTQLEAAITAGTVKQSTLDDKVFRILSAMFTMGLFDTPQPTGKHDANVTSVAHNTLARNLASQAGVLLKNNGILPLKKSTSTKFAVLGQQGSAAGLITGGGGSGQVVPYYQVDPLSALVEALGETMPPRPTNCTRYNDTDFYQPGNPMKPAKSFDDCCAICSSMPSCNAFAYQEAFSACWLKPNTAGKRANSGVTAGTCTPQPLPDNIVYNDGSDIDSAVAAAKAADVALVFIATTSHEGADRANLSMPGNEDAMASAVAAAQPNTVIVMVTPGAVLTPWSDDAAAVLNFFMPGQEYGHSAMELLFGDVNPSGKLPLTFPNKENEVGFTQSQWPGLPASDPANANYTEKLEIGYRWYDANNVTPKFPFGHGLSYTTFHYSDLSVSGRTATVTVTNNGTVAGAEVVQLYLGYPSSAGEPLKQLRGFSKHLLKPGESATPSFTVADVDASIWDVSSSMWQLVHGTFNVYVGASSRDIRLTATMTV